MKRANIPVLEGNITEDRLEEDFFFYVTYAKMCVKKLPQDKRRLGEKWVLNLLTRRTTSLKEKMLRNMHLSDLLGDMLLRKLSGIYASDPPSRDQPLPRLREELLPYHPPEVPTWLRDALGKGEEAKAIESQQDTIRHISKDGKTYVASKELPNGKGAMGFVALSMDEQDNSEGSIQERIEMHAVKEKTWQTDESGKWYKRTNVQ